MFCVPAKLSADEPPFQQDSASQNKPMMALTEAEKSFDLGQFQRAEQQADACLKQLTAYPSAEKSRLFLLKARLSFAFQRKTEMESWLREAHQTNAEVKVSRLKDPPELISYMEKLQNSQDAKTTPAQASTPAQPTPASGQTQAAPAPAVADPLKKKPFDAELKSAARFAVGIMPFGIGHFVNNQVWPGASFMLAQSSLLMLSSGLAETTLKRAEDDNFPYVRSGVDYGRFSDQASAYSFLGVGGFFGLWGLEVLHILPTLAQENPTSAQWARFATSFAPFGIAQIKNGERSKALGLAGAEALFLLLSGSLPLQGQRSLAFTFFGGSIVFGMIDGWLNHDWQVDPAKPTVWNMMLLPRPVNGGRDLAWVLSFEMNN
jgi:hypothetical protein